MKLDKVILSSIFKTLEQEAAFFKESRKHLGLGTKLEWEEEKKGDVILCSVFKTKEQEESFSECSRKKRKKKLYLKK